MASTANRTPRLLPRLGAALLGLASLVAVIALAVFVLADGWRRQGPSAPVAVARVVPSTFEQNESEHRWGAGAAISPELRGQLDRLDRMARRLAAERVGLDAQEIARMELVRRPADTCRGELEGEELQGTRGRMFTRLNAGAIEELAELTRALGRDRALALRTAERQAYRELLEAQPDAATRAAMLSFAQRRMLFLRMGNPAPAAPIDPSSLSAKR